MTQSLLKSADTALIFNYTSRLKAKKYRPINKLYQLCFNQELFFSKHSSSG